MVTRNNHKFEHQIELTRHGVRYAELRACCATPVPEEWDKLDEHDQGFGVVKISLHASRLGYTLGVAPLLLLPISAVFHWLSAHPGADDAALFAAMAALPRPAEGEALHVVESLETPAPAGVATADAGAGGGLA